MVRPLMGTVGETAGLVPVATMTTYASISAWPRGFSTRMRGLQKAGPAVEDIDAIARELRLRHIHLGLDHLGDAKAQVGHGDVVFDPIIDAVDPLKFEAGEMQHGLAHGLAGDGSGVDADATDDVALLHQNHTMAAFRALDSGPLTRRVRSR